MGLLEDIDHFKPRVEFVRADLHIHSYGNGGSFDVTDQTMTPDNIIDKAIENGLKVISVTDHNNIGNVERAVSYSEGKDLFVLPGIEISTTQGHLLVYFESITKLNTFYNRLNIHSNKELCYNGIVECLSIANELNGFGILAHIELDSGFEKTINRFGPQIEEIIKLNNLLGLEISKKESLNLYSKNDLNAERLNLLKIRISNLQLEDDYELPKIMSSDAHSINNLGKNAEGNKRLTRLKLDEYSFNAIKIAFRMGSSRVRVEDFIPNNIPHFIGLKFEGGLLADQIINFSKNLNCVIGGRGTGKSTLLESLINGSGNVTNSKLIDSDVWPDKISLFYIDETGNSSILTKIKGNPVRNESNPSTNFITIPIERYGQGETTETIQHSDENPTQLSNLLDSFIDLDALKTADSQIRNKLIDNLSEIEKLQIDVQTLPSIKSMKVNAELKVETLKKEKVGEIVEYHQGLVRERKFREELISDLTKLIKTYSDILSDKLLFNKVKELDDSKIIVGKDQVISVKKIVDSLSIFVDKLSTELKNEFGTQVELIRIQVREWAAKEKEIQNRIDNKRIELTKAGIPFDLAQISKVTNDVVYYSTKLKELELKEQTLKDKIRERKLLFTERLKIRTKIFQERDYLARSLTSNLRKTINDFDVDIKYKEGQFSQDFIDLVKEILEYRTTQVNKAKLISKNFSPFVFIEKIKKRDYSAFEQIVDSDGNKIFTKQDIDKIINRFTENNNLYKVENTVFEDFPEITVSKLTEDTSGNKKLLQRNFTKLSLGQQQAILLSILLHSKSPNPLIIDQPEDNLDSGFIYRTIVKTLRNIKEQRQVIIVTHNANIAVLSDAEMIIPLRGSNTQTRIVDRGSIDNTNTQKMCCVILEGGQLAFNRRKEIYGI